MIGLLLVDDRTADILAALILEQVNHVSPTTKRRPSSLEKSRRPNHHRNHITAGVGHGR